jgi:hypothetical protein
VKRKLLSKISIAFLGLILLPVAIAAQKNAPNVSRPPSSVSVIPAGQFNETWVEHNMYQNKGKSNEVKGMVIHTWITVQNAQNDRCQMRVGFFYENGTALTGSQTGFKSSTGKVVAYKDFTPLYLKADYTDFQIFVPYTALNMDAGQSKLKLQLFMYDYQSDKTFARSQFVNFTINQN